jgi:RNA polymerase sigma factor (sigma-70 family)
MTVKDVEPLDDAAVIAQSLGDADRFGVLYDRYAPALYRFTSRRIGPGPAEDVVAETFLAAFRGRPRYDLARPDARPWLFGILTREISRRRRDEATRYRMLATIGPEPPAHGHEDRVMDVVTAGAARMRLAAALAGLADRDRDVLLLIAWADLSYSEVAEALGLPVGTIRSRLHRARVQVRAALGNHDPLDLVEES